MTRLHVDAVLTAGEELRLPDTAAHHVRTVLRLAVEAEVIVFDGRGAEHSARLVRVARDGVVALLGEALEGNTESPLEVELIQSISRGERMDFVVQKAVELGVRRIIPVISRRTVVRLDDKRQRRREDHWRGVVRHAAEQSGRRLLPQFDAIVSLDEWLNSHRDAPAVVLHPAAGTPLARQPRPPGKISLIAGPEGGFEEREVAQMLAAGVVPVSLGPRILRTETAALSALSVMQALWGDLA